MADLQASGTYLISKERIRRFGAWSLLYAKKDFLLAEFKHAYRAYTEKAFSCFENPPKFDDLEFEGKGEIFEGYGKELAEIKDFCVLIPKQHNFDRLSSTDHILKYLHPTLSQEFASVLTAEKRLEALFRIKRKWTFNELEIYIKDSLEKG